MFEFASSFLWIETFIETEEGFSSAEVTVFMDPLNYGLRLLGLRDMNVNKDTNGNYHEKN
jgi:hypothetical protein